MKKLLPFLFLLIYISARAQSNDDLKIEAGKNGSTYSFCSFDGVLTFSNGDSMGVYFPPGTANLCLVKRDSLGSILWTRHLKGGANTSTGYGVPGIGICTDQSDNVYVSATFSGTLEVNGNNVLTGGGAFIAKFDPSGNVVWAKKSSSANSTGVDVSVDAAGNVYATGLYFANSITFDALTPIAYQGNSTFLNYDDIFVAKFNSSGAAQWIRGLHGGLHKYVMCIKSSAAGSVYLSGNAAAGNMLTGVGSVPFNYDSYIAKYSASGNMQWMKKATCGYSDNYMEDLALDKTSHIYATGQFKAQMIFGGTAAALTTTTSGNAKDLFVVKYDTSGNGIWSQRAISTPVMFSSGRGMGIAIDSSCKNIFVAGQVDKDALFSPLPVLNYIINEVYVVRIDSNDQGQCISSIPYYSYSEDIAADQKGNAYIIGRGYNQANFIRTSKIKNNCSIAWSDSVKQRVYQYPLATGSEINSSDSYVFPNPGSGAYTLHRNNNERAELFVEDLTGRVILNLNGITSSHIEFDLSQASPGIYIVKIRSGKTAGMHKIVKQ
jgi:hypothetical protein